MNTQPIHDHRTEATIANVRNRISTIEELNAKGVGTALWQQQFELACLRQLLAAMDSEPVAVPESWESCTHLLPIGELIRRLEEQTGEKISYASEAERHKRDLVMMVKLLVRTVRKYNPESQQAKDFLAYLQREGLISTSDILRDGAKDPE